MPDTAVPIDEQHKDLKRREYWKALTSGGTARYKENALNALLCGHFPPACESLLDIGCGSSSVLMHYKERFGASYAACMDYDEAIVTAMRSERTGVEWIIGDIMDLKLNRNFDLVFMLDMLHEVYSFQGRGPDGLHSAIDCGKGKAIVAQALRAVCAIVAPGGGVVITDNVLPPENAPLLVRLRNEPATLAVSYFLREYTTLPIRAQLSGSELRIGAHDFSVLLTQYNKVKHGDWDRWNVERLEAHQYFTRSEYEAVFDTAGFDMHAIVGTPEEAAAEWAEDFEMLEGPLPEKRITILAMRKQGAAL